MTFDKLASLANNYFLESNNITFEELHKKYAPDSWNIEFAYNYAKDVLKKRWVDAPEIPIEEAKKAEKLISEEQHYAARYAIDVMGQRWIDAPNVPEEVAKQAETSIIEADDHWEYDPLFDYMRAFIKGRWDEAESERCAIGQSIKDLIENKYGDIRTKKADEQFVQRYKDYLDEVGYSDLEESYKLR